MTRNLRGLWCGTLSVPAPPDILGSSEDGGEGGRLLRVGVSGIQGRYTGGPSTPHHLQCGGGCGGTTLGCSDGGECGRAEQARTRGQTPKCPLLRGFRNGCIIRTAMAPGGLQHHSRYVQQGVPKDQH